jgi:hypothetical protein
VNIHSAPVTSSFRLIYDLDEYCTRVVLMYTAGVLKYTYGRTMGSLSTRVLTIP